MEYGDKSYQRIEELEEELEYYKISRPMKIDGYRLKNGKWEIIR